MASLRLGCLAWGALLAFIVPSCDSGGGFECGRKADFGDFVYHCDGPGQICVCRTSSCAQPDRSCDATGYRYLDAPFAHESGCVEAEDLPWSLPASAEARECPVAAPDAGVDAAGTDASGADALGTDASGTDAPATTANEESVP